MTARISTWTRRSLRAPAFTDNKDPRTRNNVRLGAGKVVLIPMQNARAQNSRLWLGFYWALCCYRNSNLPRIILTLANSTFPVIDLSWQEILRAEFRRTLQWLEETRFSPRSLNIARHYSRDRNFQGPCRLSTTMQQAPYK